jgi:hypothetical protein
MNYMIMRNLNYNIRKPSIEAEAKMRRNDEAWVMPIRPVK